MTSQEREDGMKRLIFMLVGGMMVCTTLSAAQPIDQPNFSQAQVDRIERLIAKGLESPDISEQVDATMKLHRMWGLVPGHDWGRCIIPLMHILNGEDNQPPARLLAAMVLHELRSERGDFAISRNALFTDDARVKRYCTILARTRLVEKTKL